MTILHVSAECYPAAKVGGMGDVVGALPRYLYGGAVSVPVVIPWYDNDFFRSHSFTEIYRGKFRMLGIHQYHVLRENNNVLGFPLHAIAIAHLLDTPLPYGYENDTERHLAFQIAVASWLTSWEKLPDVVHCHDHHTALLPFFFLHAFAFNRLRNVPTVLTVHNGGYQGWISWEKEYLLPAYDIDHRGLLEWNHSINALACGIKCCWRFTTVSPTYLEELKSEPELGKLIQDEASKGYGILNGIDDSVWNPTTDGYLDIHYTAETAEDGKRQNKESLCRSFGMNADVPLVIYIGRLLPEKGADLLADSIFRFHYEAGPAASFLLLGSGLTQVEQSFRSLAASLPGMVNCYIGYNEALAHRMYAAADFLLMPSRSEPCGLNQLYGLRYGTVPIVRSVGGLKDSVIDVGDPGGFGIRFEQPSVEDICSSLHRARALYAQPNRLAEIRKRIMKFDHSWTIAAQNYLALYRAIAAPTHES